jgi:hypothetical protein
MRVHSLRVTTLLFCTALAVPVHPQPTKENFASTLLKSAGTSAAGAVGVAVAKELTGKFYDATCAKEVTKDVAEQYFCNALAGFSGRDEQEWKAEIKKELADINVKLAALEQGQARLQYDLTQHHQEMYRLFKQAAAEQIATSNEADFETLWKAYRRQFDEDTSDVNRDAMIKFARQILDRKLDDKLALYNTVLTTSFRGNQALLRYPFFDYKEKKAFRAPPEAFNNDRSVDTMYDGAEKAFVDARARQEKVSLMVLWAIKVLESDCQMRTPCVAPPFSSAEFKKDYDAYTKDQLVAFNEGLDWLLFTYGNPHVNPWFLPVSSENYLTRANFLNASVVGGGKGMWGRVISMGNAWDGSLNMQCGAKSGVVKPRFSYLVPVDGRYNPSAMDWWASRSGNDVYDEVRFSKEWKVYHYYIPDAKEGPCTVSESLPAKGVMPWVQPGTAVMKAKTAENQEVVFGSFIAIQRAGGTYAMASGGQWRRRPEPSLNTDGTTSNVKNERYDWSIDTSGRFPQASVLYEGRGEYKVLSGGRVHRYNQIYLYNEKKIYFPEDREVKLGLLQGHDCAKTCRESRSGEMFILDYNIENGGTDEKEKGKLDAVVSVFLSPFIGNIDARTIPNIKNYASGSGVFIDGSYGSTADRKAKTVEGLQYGSLKTEPNTGYHLQYLIEFDMHTEGHGAGATHWMYRGKITPAWLFLTK